ncbi:hypothetical protein MNBD_ALPHA11-1960 [hydrothermal vent metagenome]|uniref:Uncharacterized protein n=1 Tax=hydrothermal vent metagenome TaxID=652676 RepID=A0A3B0UZ18_9ZZZZ
MSRLLKIALPVLATAIALSSAASAQWFTGTITSDRERVIDHRNADTRPNEVVPARRGVDPSSLLVTMTPLTPPAPASTGEPTPTVPTPPSNGGFNPIGDVSCFDGQVILYQDDYEVYYSDCSKYIYNYRAISGNVIVDVFMSSFDGQYTTKMVGFAH